MQQNDCNWGAFEEKTLCLTTIVQCIIGEIYQLVMIFPETVGNFVTHSSFELVVLQNITVINDSMQVVD